MTHIKSVGFALVILLSGLFVGCNKDSSAPSGGASSSDKIKIGFIVKQAEEPWFKREWKFAQEAADKDGFELLPLPAPSGEKALAAIDNLAVSGAQGFVICTPDVKLGSAIVAKSKSRGMKVMAVDDQFLGPDGQPMTDVPYLGIAAHKIGESVGQSLYDEMKKRNWPVDETGMCVITYEQLETARQRTDGAVEAIKAAGFPDKQIFKAPQKTTDQKAAIEAVDILLVQHPEVKRWLICGLNDSAVLGGVRSTEGRGFTADNVIGIGINGTDCIDELSKPQPTGFFGSALLRAKQHGYDTSDMMYKWIKDGTEPPKDTRTIGILITRDNFKQVLKDQGVD